LLDYRRSDARIAENGFATSSGVSKSAKVVLGAIATRETLSMKTKANPRARATRRSTDSAQGTRFAFSSIPEKAIGLGDAYSVVFKAIMASPKVLLRVPRLEEDMGCRIQDDDEKAHAAAYERGKSTPDERKIMFPWGRAAHLFYYWCLEHEEIPTYVRDPETGDILKLEPVGWVMPVIRLQRSRSDEVDLSNRSAIIRGAYEPVFHWRDEFERWFQKTFGSDLSKRRGRKPGSGSWEHADEPLVEEMQRLIDSGSAKSAEDAARLVEDRAAGSGTLVSKRTRLAKRYRKRFPSERN
jgi:hypothetical protein